MKHTVRLIVAALLAVAFFSACTVVINDPLVEGDVYLAYYWDSLHPIRQFSDNNPWQPAILVNNTYYRTGAGYYFGQYTSYNGVVYGFDYTLTSDYAYSSDPYGPVSSYFQLELTEYGMHFYDWTYSRSLGSTAAAMRQIAKSPAVALLQSGNSVSVIEKTVNGYTMRLEYWKVE
jgi:hypothetical protein